MIGTVKVKNKKTGQWVAVDAVKGQQYDSGWVTLKETVFNSITYIVQYRRVGSVVYIRGMVMLGVDLNDRVQGAAFEIGVLPEGCRPQQFTSMITDTAVYESTGMSGVTYSHAFKVEVHTDGKVIVRTPAFFLSDKENMARISFGSVDCSFLID